MNIQSLLSVERFPETERVPKDELTSESSQTKQRVTRIAYPPVLSVSQGSSLAINLLCGDEDSG